MKPSKDKMQDLIDQYFEGRLSGDEHSSFKEQLKDPDFQEDFAFHKKMAAALGQQSKAPELKQLFQQQEKKIEQRHIIRRRLAIAASILVLLSVGTYLFTTIGGGSEQDQLFAALKTQRAKPMIEGVKRGNDAASSDPLADCIAPYVDHKFKVAVTCFEQKVAVDPLNFTAKQLLGDSYFMNKQFDQSLQQFDQLLADPKLVNSSLRQELEWNRLLSLRLLNSPEFAKAKEAIAQNPSHDFNEDAKNLK